MLVVSPEFAAIKNIMGAHPHTRVVCDAYLQVIHGIRDGNLNARFFPDKAEDIEDLCYQVSFLEKIII